MITKNSRVQLFGGAADMDIPEGSFGTVIDIVPEDEIRIVVQLDCRPNLTAYYYSSEVGKEIREVA